MSLYRKNDNPFLELGLLKLNEEWDTYWGKTAVKNLPDKPYNLITEKKMLTIFH